MSDSETSSSNSVREVVAVFHDTAKLEAAAEKPLNAGFLEKQLSILGDKEALAEALGHHFQPIEVMEDAPRVPQRAFVFKADPEAAEAVAIGLPIYVGAMGGAVMVVASGGALAKVLLAAATYRPVSSGIGGAIAAASGKTHADRLEVSIHEGGILFWVFLGKEREEAQAHEIPKQSGCVGVHAHQITRTCVDAESPFKNWDPDPYLDCTWKRRGTVLSQSEQLRRVQMPQAACPSRFFPSRCAAGGLTRRPDRERRSEFGRI
jgi:hypothetical protein